MNTQVKTTVNQDEKVEFWGNLPFALLHLGCLGVFFVGWSKPALVVAFILVVIRMFGLTAGYHRYFSHRSFKTSRGFQFILALLGAMSFQKDPLWWAAHHRLHHRHVDTDRDVHSPSKKGFFWAHMGWVLTKKNADLKPDAFVPDLMKFPELVFLNRHQKVVPFAMLGVLIGLGLWMQTFRPEWGASALQLVVWGFFVSTIVLHHCTFTVNSWAHMFGYRRFETKDESRNNPIVAFLTMGEGWHNNHHRYPWAEKHGIAWWEIDLTHGVLKLFSFFGIVWDLTEPPKAS